MRPRRSPAHPTGPVRRVAGWRRLLLAAAAAAVVVGCGQTPAASPEATGGDGEGSWEFPVCDDVPDLAAPAEAYRDEPIYVADEMPVAEVKAWAESQPGFEEIWIDWDHLGWISVGFSRGAAARQRDLEAEFAGVGVVAVPVEHTRAELDALASRVFLEFAPIRAEHGLVGVGVSVHKGVVDVIVEVLTEDFRREVERRFSGEPLCVGGVDPATVPAPGPQPSGGEGWRLLADQNGGGESWWPIGLVADASGMPGLWEFLDTPLPEVDFEKHVVISFGVSYSGSCPEIRLDDVVVDGAVVYPEIVDLKPGRMCTADANPHAYVVALERSRLPSGPFAIQLEAETHSYTKPEQRLLVDADLSRPAAVPEPGAVRPDASLSDSTPDESGLLTQPGFSHLYRLDTRCGIEWLGEVNDVAWRTDEAMPEEWKNAVEADGGLNVSMTMYIESEPLIRAELNGETVIYKPTADEPPDCDQP